MPDNDFYNHENKSPQVKEKVIQFLNQERAEGKVFNFVEEIFKYCYGDVLILASALAVFEKEFEAVTNVCIFEESTTAASAAVKVFQRNHLEHKKPIVLDARPSVSVKASIISQKYLAWFGDVEKVPIEISSTTGERKIGKYSVDGFVEPCEKFPKGLVIEFFDDRATHRMSCKLQDYLCATRDPEDAEIGPEKLANGVMGTFQRVSHGYLFIELMDTKKVVPLAYEPYRDSRGATWYQFPVVLAEAITVHKSQGMTFDGVVVVRRKMMLNGPAGRAPFAIPAIFYTAISRARSMKLSRIVDVEQVKWRNCETTTRALEGMRRQMHRRMLNSN
ncbi:unnamed protein product [Caenorhabditis sp. 36 PRJEB53466]|nr:unnamed protein product [Caenorhabditis sp. 36 PRJEB53466]